MNGNFMAGIEARFGDQMRAVGSETRAWAERVLARLDMIGVALDRLDKTEDRRHVTGSGDANAAGEGQIIIEGPRPGFAWTIENVTTNVPSGTGATIGVLYVGSQSPVNAKLRLDEAAFEIQDAGNGIFVPPGSPVIIALTGVPANGRMNAALQIAEVQVP